MVSSYISPWFNWSMLHSSLVRILFLCFHSRRFCINFRFRRNLSRHTISNFAPPFASSVSFISWHTRYCKVYKYIYRDASYNVSLALPFIFFLSFFFFIKRVVSSRYDVLNSSFNKRSSSLFIRLPRKPLDLSSQLFFSSSTNSFFFPPQKRKRGGLPSWPHTSGFTRLLAYLISFITFLFKHSALLFFYKTLLSQLHQDLTRKLKNKRQRSSRISPSLLAASLSAELAGCGHLHFHVCRALDYVTRWIRSADWWCRC